MGTQGRAPDPTDNRGGEPVGAREGSLICAEISRSLSSRGCLRSDPRRH